MSSTNNNMLLNVLSLIAVIALIIAINIHLDLSHLFYMLGGSSSGDTIIDGRFNTFFLSSLGITSAIIFITFLLIVKCKTALTKVLIIVADVLLIFMVFNFPQERVLHNFSFDTHAQDIVNTTPDASSIVMGTSDTSLLIIVLVHIVIMLIGVIRTYKSKNSSIQDKASAYD
ncbi:MAG: hypothetical protein DSZ29_02595 [Aquificaceae bacterium]|nr:MAG: hypothetical protein DSZ29_02595 [Aquificaceae bacterium]